MTSGVLTVSMEMLYFNLVGCVPAFFSAIVMGSSVDVFGRKPVLLVSTLGMALMSAICACIIKFKLHPNFFYLAFGIDGFCGNIYVFLIAQHAIIADATNSKDSIIFWIAIFHSLPRLASVATDISIGYLIKYMGYVWTSFIAAFPPALNLIFIAITLPETLPYPKRGISSTCSAMLGVFKLYTKDRDKYTRRSLFISLLIFFLAVTDVISLSSVDTLFQKGSPLLWDSTLIGYYAAARTVTHSLVGMLYFTGCRRLRFGSRRIRMSDEAIALSGCVMMAGSFVMEANVMHTYQMFIVPIIAIPSFAITPVTRGVMSSLVGPDKQGVMFTSIALIEVGCSLASSTIYNKIYADTVAAMPGTVYYLMAGVALIAAMLYWPFFHFNKRVPKPREVTTSSQ